MSLLGYVLAFLAIAAISPLIGISFLFVTPLIRRFRTLAPTFIAFSSAASTAAAVLLFVWVAGLLGIRLAYLMFLIPLLLSIRNDFARMGRARRGATPVARAVGDDYDADFQVKMEYGYLAGDIVGVFLPLLFLRPLPFV